MTLPRLFCASVLCLILSLAAAACTKYPLFASGPLQRSSGDVYEVFSPTVVLAVPTFVWLYLIATIGGDLSLVHINPVNYRLERVVTTINAGPGRSVMGITHDPFQPNTFYITTNSLRWDLQGIPDVWHNAKVEKVTLKGKSELIVDEKPVISGLPVSASNWGTYSTAIDSLTGELYIAVGTFNTAGVPSDADNNIEDCLLSGSVLKADIRTEGLTRVLEWSSDDPATAQLVTSPEESGISVYAVGVRSPHQIQVYTNNALFIFDGGANIGLDGEDVVWKSTGCDTDAPLTEKMPDRLVKVRSGKWYGHPNRTRGKKDAKQCEFISALLSDDEADAVDGYAPPLLTTAEAEKDGILTSGIVGHLEYSANWWNGKLRGSTLGLEVGVNKNDDEEVTAAMLSFNRRTKEVKQVADIGGLASTVDAQGAVLSPQFFSNSIGVARPRTILPKDNKPEIGSIFPTQGIPGSKVFITGYNLSIGEGVKIGDVPCKKVRYVKSGMFIQCTVPKLNTTEQVPVQVGQAQQKKGFRVLKPLSEVN